MTTYGEKIILQTRGFSHIINITEKVQEIISNSRITSGLPASPLSAQLQASQLLNMSLLLWKT